MDFLWRYLRQHRWQRRALSLSLAAIAGAGLAWLAWPTLRESQALKALASADPARRQQAILAAVSLGRQRAGFVQRLEDRLDQAGDGEFLTLVEVLNRLGRFERPDRPGHQLDRYWCLSLAAARSADLRRLLLHDLILGGRDNPYVRRGLNLAAGDPSPQVCAAAAVLAARLGDDATLCRLLRDAQPGVRAAAALDAALADRRGCKDALTDLLQRAETDEEVASAALGLWKWSPETDVPGMVGTADEQDKAVLRDLLMDVLCRPAGGTEPGPAAQSAVVSVLTRAAERRQTPPAMAFVAAGRMRLREAAPFVLETLQQVTESQDPPSPQALENLAAAVGAAKRLRMNQTGRLSELIKRLWHERTALAMILACEALGDLLAGQGSDSSAAVGAMPASRPESVLELLRRAVEYSVTPTPVPSAAAAVAIFKIAPDSADDALQVTCQSAAPLAGDYVAWELRRLALLPARGGVQYGPAAERVARALLEGAISTGEQRSAGAMLSAYLAGAGGRAEAVAGQIQRHLQAQGAPPRDPRLAGSYQCALLVLGRKGYAPQAAALSEADDFSPNRALTALLLAGRPEGPDGIFAGPRFDPRRDDSLLTSWLMARVLADLVTDLPHFDIDAPPHVRAFQCRVLRDYYLIHRGAVLDRMKRS